MKIATATLLLFACADVALTGVVGAGADTTLSSTQLDESLFGATNHKGKVRKNGVVLTQNLPPRVMGSVACPQGGNAYYRIFDLKAAGFEVEDEIELKGVEVGIFQTLSNNPDGKAIIVRVYDTDDLDAVKPIGDPSGDGDHMIFQGSVDVEDQGQTVLFVPAKGKARSGFLIVEVYADEEEGNHFWMGMNSDGETGPCYFANPTCGIDSPTMLSEVGIDCRGTPCDVFLNVIVDPKKKKSAKRRMRV